MPHVFLRGKTCSYVPICIISDFAFCSIFLFPIFSQYPMLDSGGARHLRERNSLNSFHIFTFGDMSIFNMVPSTHSLHVIPILVLLWFLKLLCPVDVCVLSNLVYLGSSLPKLPQDHKVSIFITVMCMRISCWCTYCLQEGLMSMKVHFLYSYHLLWCI